MRKESSSRHVHTDQLKAEEASLWPVQLPEACVPISGKLGRDDCSRSGKEAGCILIEAVALLGKVLRHVESLRQCRPHVGRIGKLL